MSTLGISPVAWPAKAPTPAPVSATAGSTPVTPVVAATDNQSKPQQPMNAEHIAQLRETLRAIAETLNAGTRLVIKPAQNSGQYVYEFVDPASGKVVRRFPHEELVAAARLKSGVSGSIVDATA